MRPVSLTKGKLLHDEKSKPTIEEYKLKNGENYIRNLFDDDRNNSSPDMTHCVGPLITRSKATGPHKSQIQTYKR